MHPEKLRLKNWQKALKIANSSRRCRAKTRAGGSCLSPAMKNGRCRMHGGKSPGAPLGKAHGRYRHGFYTHESKRLRQYVSALNQQSEQLLTDYFEIY